MEPGSTPGMTTSIGIIGWMLLRKPGSIPPSMQTVKGMKRKYSRGILLIQGFEKRTFIKSFNLV